jgi:hypothetical protein
LADGILESSELIVENGLSLGCPKTKKKGGVGSNGSGDGTNNSVGCAILDHSVETGRVPSTSGVKTLLGAE